MPSPNEAKLEELRKGAEEAFKLLDGTIGKEGRALARIYELLDRAFQLGRMEQHERDKEAVAKHPWDDNCHGVEGLHAAICDNLASVSPVEGEE